MSFLSATIRIWCAALLLLVGLPVGASDPPQDAAAEALEGAWLISVGGDARDRFLIVSGVQRDGGRLWPGATRYGFLGGAGKTVSGWNAEIGGDMLRLKFVTPADAVMEVQFQAGDTLVEGSLRTKTGKILPVRWTRIADEELEELRAGPRELARQAAMSRIRPDSKIWLVYVGATDCPYCRGYEAEFFGRKQMMEQTIPDFPSIGYVKASLGGYRGTVTPGLLPPELRWLAGRGADGKPLLRKRGTPFFAAVVDDRVVAQGHGIVALESSVGPAINEALARRQELSRR
ncbi:hypothetical protein [Caldimonas tepidiphila]|uniref:hypothetical protein n=1 Tax=Caldimonas tepidiphila TaxID=2315841 RepID=UPI000E5A857C|nr:hypothetical protein [Caldimonas tepidiphila]